MKEISPVDAFTLWCNLSRTKKNASPADLSPSSDGRMNGYDISSAGNTPSNVQNGTESNSPEDISSEPPSLQPSSNPIIGPSPPVVRTFFGDEKKDVYCQEPIPSKLENSLKMKGMENLCPSVDSLYLGPTLPEADHSAHYEKRLHAILCIPQLFKEQQRQVMSGTRSSDCNSDSIRRPNVYVDPENKVVDDNLSSSSISRDKNNIVGISIVDLCAYMIANLKEQDEGIYFATALALADLTSSMLHEAARNSEKSVEKLPQVVPIPKETGYDTDIWLSWLPELLHSACSLAPTFPLCDFTASVILPRMTFGVDLERVVDRVRYEVKYLSKSVSPGSYQGNAPIPFSLQHHQREGASNLDPKTEYLGSIRSKSVEWAKDWNSCFGASLSLSKHYFIRFLEQPVTDMFSELPIHLPRPAFGTSAVPLFSPVMQEDLRSPAHGRAAGSHIVDAADVRHQIFIRIRAYLCAGNMHPMSTSIGMLERSPMLFYLQLLVERTHTKTDFSGQNSTVEFFQEKAHMSSPQMRTSQWFCHVFLRQLLGIPMMDSPSVSELVIGIHFLANLLSAVSCFLRHISFIPPVGPPSAEAAVKVLMKDNIEKQRSSLSLISFRDWVVGSCTFHEALLEPQLSPASATKATAASSHGERGDVEWEAISFFWSRVHAAYMLALMVAPVDSNHHVDLPHRHREGGPTSAPLKHEASVALLEHLASADGYQGSAQAARLEQPLSIPGLAVQPTPLELLHQVAVWCRERLVGVQQVLKEMLSESKLLRFYSMSSAEANVLNIPHEPTSQSFEFSEEILYAPHFSVLKPTQAVCKTESSSTKVCKVNPKFHCGKPPQNSLISADVEKSFPPVTTVFSVPEHTDKVGKLKEFLLSGREDVPFLPLQSGAAVMAAKRIRSSLLLPSRHRSSTSFRQASALRSSPSRGILFESHVLLRTMVRVLPELSQISDFNTNINFSHWKSWVRATSRRLEWVTPLYISVFTASTNSPSKQAVAGFHYLFPTDNVESSTMFDTSAPLPNSPALSSQEGGGLESQLLRAKSFPTIPLLTADVSLIEIGLISFRRFIGEMISKIVSLAASVGVYGGEDGKPEKISSSDSEALVHLLITLIHAVKMVVQCVAQCPSKSQQQQARHCNTSGRYDGVGSDLKYLNEMDQGRSYFRIRWLLAEYISSLWHCVLWGLVELVKLSRARTWVVDTKSATSLMELLHQNQMAKKQGSDKAFSAESETAPFHILLVGAFAYVCEALEPFWTYNASHSRATGGKQARYDSPPLESLSFRTRSTFSSGLSQGSYSVSSRSVSSLNDRHLPGSSEEQLESSPNMALGEKESGGIFEHWLYFDAGTPSLSARAAIALASPLHVLCSSAVQLSRTLLPQNSTENSIPFLPSRAVAQNLNPEMLHTSFSALWGSVVRIETKAIALLRKRVSLGSEKELRESMDLFSYPNCTLLGEEKLALIKQLLYVMFGLSDSLQCLRSSICCQAAEPCSWKADIYLELSSLFQSCLVLWNKLLTDAVKYIREVIPQIVRPSLLTLETSHTPYFLEESTLCSSEEFIQGWREAIDLMLCIPTVVSPSEEHPGKNTEETKNHIMETIHPHVLHLVHECCSVDQRAFRFRIQGIRLLCTVLGHSLRAIEPDALWAFMHKEAVNLMPEKARNAKSTRTKHHGSFEPLFAMIKKKLFPLLLNSLYHESFKHIRSAALTATKEMLLRLQHSNSMNTLLTGGKGKVLSCSFPSWMNIFVNNVIWGSLVPLGLPNVAGTSYGQRIALLQIAVELGVARQQILLPLLRLLANDPVVDVRLQVALVLNQAIKDTGLEQKNFNASKAKSRDPAALSYTDNHSPHLYSNLLESIQQRIGATVFTGNTTQGYSRKKDEENVGKVNSLSPRIMCSSNCSVCSYLPISLGSPLTFSKEELVEIVEPLLRNLQHDSSGDIRKCAFAALSSPSSNNI